MTVSYQYEVASSTSGGFTRLLFMWKGSLYKLIYRELLLFLAAFGLLSALYRNAFNSDQRKIFEKMVMYCDTFINLIPLSFVLGFYVAYVAGRWWQQYMAIPWPDKIMHSIALYVSGSDEHARMVRRTLMRYLNLTLILVLRSISSAVKRRFPTLEHVVEAGFMTSVELEMFQSVPSVEFNTYWIPCTWFISLLKETKKKNQIEDSQGLHIIMEEFNEFRSKCGLLWSYDWVSIPLVYTQVVTIATYSFFLAALVGRQYVDAAKKPLQMEIDIYLPVFTILQFFFFMGLLKVAEQLINPFGDDDEDFELNWLIDRHTKVSYLGVDILMASAPPLVKDMYFDQVDLTLPYTEASVAYKKKTYRGSVHNMTVPEDKHTMFLPEISEEDEDRTPTPRSSLSNVQSMVHSRPTEPALVAAAAAGTWRSHFPSTQSFHKAFEVDSQLETSATAARNLEMCVDMAAFPQKKETGKVNTKSSENNEDGKITRPLSRSESVPTKRPIFVAESMLGWPSSSTLGCSNTSYHYSKQSIEMMNYCDSSANFGRISERTPEPYFGPETLSSTGATEKGAEIISNMTSKNCRGTDDGCNSCGSNCKSSSWSACTNRTGRCDFAACSGNSDRGGGEVGGSSGGGINVCERCSGGGGGGAAGSSNCTTRGSGENDGDSDGNGDCGVVGDSSAGGTSTKYVTEGSGGDFHGGFFGNDNKKNLVTDQCSENNDADDATIDVRNVGEISSNRNKKLNLHLDVTCNHSPYLFQSSPESPSIPKQYEHYLCKHKEETDYVTFRKSFRSACLAKVRSCPKLVLVKRQHSANSGRKKGVRWKPMVNNVSWRDPSCVRRQTVEIVPVTPHPSGVNLFFPSKTNDEVNLLNQSILDTHCLWCRKQTEYRQALLQHVVSGDCEQFVNTSADSVSNSSFSHESCSLHNRMNLDKNIKGCPVPSTRHIIGTEVLTSKSLPFQERRATVSTLNLTGTELEAKRWQSRSFWERGFFKKMKLLYNRKEIKVVPSVAKKTSLYLNNKRLLSQSLPNIVFPHFQSESQSMTNEVPTSVLLNKAMPSIRFSDVTSTESDSSSRFASIMEMQEEDYDEGNSSSSVDDEDKKSSIISIHSPFASNSVTSGSNSGYSNTPYKDPSLQLAGWTGITDSDHLHVASSNGHAEPISVLKEICSVPLSDDPILNASSNLQEVIIDNGNNSSSNELLNKSIS